MKIDCQAPAVQQRHGGPAPDMTGWQQPRPFSAIAVPAHRLANYHENAVPDAGGYASWPAQGRHDGEAPACPFSAIAVPAPPAG
jgi:hypothetical protein